MNIEKFTTQSCCGGISITYKIDKPIDIDLVNSFVSLGFTELKHFTKAGILYVDNSEFIVTGPIGSNRLQIKCKKKDCDQRLIGLEGILKNI